ncbi:MAG: tRNA (N6-isopentenyl adenosine(37)-C2)-methylthiotransferase MiaB [Verrucomicrobia bacterium]|nr:tRNA (N6-isopentenyl adenosine(37)-C2)-methylthiotransferase MiaB [Verrucomicrobiota bacterium]
MGTRAFYIRTYGCQMNELDSELVAGGLVKAGFQAAASLEEAGVVVLNTCTVRDSAERKALGLLGLLARRKRERQPELVLVLCGCVAQAHGTALLERVPELNVVCGTRNIQHLPKFVRRAIEGAGPIVDIADDDMVDLCYEPGTRSGRVKAFVSVMRGCDNYCSYCVVPYVRGREVSRPAGGIVAEVRRLVERGAKEVTLLGQNVNSYGRGLDDANDHAGPRDFAGLLEQVGAVEGLRRLRFVTSHPKDISERLIEAIAGLPVVCEYLHFPAQAGSDTVLARMNRGYTRGHYLGLVEKLRARVPGIALSTDLIVGFPGETDAEFSETVSLVETVRYDGAFMFKYSPRPGTAAAALDDDVPLEVKKARLARILELQDEISLEKNRALIGRQMEVLVEGPSRKNAARYSGRTRCNRIAVFEACPERAGELVTVEIRGATPHTLHASLTESGPGRARG